MSFEYTRFRFPVAMAMLIYHVIIRLGLELAMEQIFTKTWLWCNWAKGLL